MANNVIIRGFKSIGKLIGRGYSRLTGVGTFVKICRLFNDPNVCQKLSTELNLCQKLSTELNLCQRVFTESGL